MLQGKTITAFIPAKAESQRLPGKTLMPCDGTPLIRRVVDLAKECGFFDEIVVSTESREVLEACSVHRGEDVLWHPRPLGLCEPTSSVWDAVKHYHRPKTDYIMLLHLTSPCLKADTVEQAADMMSHNEDICDALVSVNFSNPFNWSVCTYPPDFSKEEGTQFMPAHWELNNAIFIAKWEKLYEVENGYSLHWIPQCIPTDEAIDINDETDLHIAEAILQWRRRDEGKVEKPATEDSRTFDPPDAGKRRTPISTDARSGADKPV